MIVPATMQAILLNEYSGAGALTLEERPTPQPGAGEVLVKLAAAPINPSDLMFLEGLYGVHPKLPQIAGFEGSGVIVAAGSGLYGRALIGRRVACSMLNGGTWAEYCATAATGCIPLIPSISTLAGAMVLVNPTTAWAMVEFARTHGAKAIVQTAAASTLGRMVIRLGQRFDLPIINVVRRSEQVALLQALGATHILNSSDAHFDQQLKELCRELKASIALDAVAGPMVNRLATALPRHSTIVVYGGLEQAAIQLNPGDLIFRDQHIQGFYLGHWISQQPPLALLQAVITVQRLLARDLRSEVRACLPLSQYQRALSLYSGDMTGGKVLFIPQLGRD